MNWAQTASLCQQGGKKLTLELIMLQAILYIPEEEDDFHIDIYEEKEKGHQIAEIFNKDGRLIINLFNNPNDLYKELDLEEFLNVLQKSFEKLK